MNRTLCCSLALTAGLLTTPAAGARLRVVATTADLASLAAQVGGADADVAALAGASEDPHYVDPKPSLVLPLSRADLLVVNGLELEVGWLPPLLVNARNRAIQPGGAGHLDASAHVHRLQVRTGRVDRSMGDVHPGGNPHYLHDPRAAREVALALAERMASLDPDRATAYRALAAAFADELARLAATQAERFRALPTPRRRLVSYHESLAYLYDWLGLSQVATLEPKPGIQPTPGHLAKVLQAMRGEGVRVVVQEEYFPRKTSDTVARLADAQVVVLPGGARFADGERYVDRVRRAVEGLHAALSR